MVSELNEKFKNSKETAYVTAPNLKYSCLVYRILSETRNKIVSEKYIIPFIGMPAETSVDTNYSNKNACLVT